MGEKKFLKNDKDHRYATHVRWLTDGKVFVNRDMQSQAYIDYDAWINAQCFMCQFYVNLSGEFGRDWGACTNPDSKMDGRVVYEHDGCDHFSLAEDEEEF